MDDLKSIGINYELKKAIKPNANNVITDGYSGYNAAYEVVNHTPMVVRAKEAHKKLPWVHTMISNAKRMFLGTHHSINKKYLQNY
jgi:ISXO2 transposase-like protein